MSHGLASNSADIQADSATGRSVVHAQGRHNLVLGLGDTGLSCIRYLLAHGEHVTIADSRPAPPQLAAVAAQWPALVCHCGAWSVSLLDKVSRVVLSPGVDRRDPLIVEALRRGLPVVGDVELFAMDVAAHQPQARLVGITGTNGKSTVTALIAAMAEESGIRVRAGANLGPPALDLLESPRPDWYALELSSYQLESTQSLRLDVAILLNVTPDHMDRYNSVADYAAAKARIFTHAALAVVNADDPTVQSLLPAGIPVKQFSVQAQADYWVDSKADLMVLEQGVAKSIMPIAQLRLGGRHNAANALAALATGDAMGLSRESMRAALDKFLGLPHRMQVVTCFDGVDYINDSKGTNVGATIAAIKGITHPVVLIAGGDAKGQDFAPLAQAALGRVRHTVLLGRDRDLLAQALREVCSIQLVSDMAQAVAAARAHAMPGDAVLLSPACASTDMYRNYAARGEAFVAAVRELSV